MSEGWSGNDIGDFVIGAKFNILSEARQNAMAFALRGAIKLPTGSKDEGSSTGKADFSFDAIISKEINQRVEVSGFAGLIMRGSPDGLELTNGLRWGFGAGFPSRNKLRLTTELHGEFPFDDTVINSLDFTGDDGTTRRSVADPQEHRCDDWPDVAEHERLLHWRRPQLPFNHARPQRLRPVRERERRLSRLPVPDRLPPGRPGLCAAGAAGPGAAADGRPAEPPADGQGALQSVHGRSLQDVDGHGRCLRPGRRPAHLPVDGPDRLVCQPERA